MYHAKAPSARKVFHKQSKGFEYSIPTVFPFGRSCVGWLYIRVNAYKAFSASFYFRKDLLTVSAGCITIHYGIPLQVKTRTLREIPYIPRMHQTRSYLLGKSMYYLLLRYHFLLTVVLSNYSWGKYQEGSKRFIDCCNTLAIEPYEINRKIKGSTFEYGVDLPKTP